MGAAANKQSGFTLLEVLAAFFIFAVGFAAVMQILSGSVRTSNRAHEFSQAALWAQTVLDSVGLDIPVEAGSYNGDFDDDYTYELAIEPYEFSDEDGLEIVEVENIVLYRVALTVNWGGPERLREARYVTLRTALETP